MVLSSLQWKSLIFLNSISDYFRWWCSLHTREENLSKNFRCVLSQCLAFPLTSETILLLWKGEQHISFCFATDQSHAKCEYSIGGRIPAFSHTHTQINFAKHTLEGYATNWFGFLVLLLDISCLLLARLSPLITANASKTIFDSQWEVISMTPKENSYRHEDDSSF